MNFTGERMVPGAAGRDELFFEHVVRYAFAARHAPGRRVLDAGCGCGYGAYFLRRAGAAEVLGVDIDAASIDFSRRHFGVGDGDDTPRFAVGDVLALPLPDASVDLVTCFEVFEHLEHPLRLLEELRRVLDPRGVLLISTPNALTYEADTADGVNPFHHREYAPDEFRSLLEERFADVSLFVQNPFGGMGIFPMDRSLDAAAAVELRVLSPPAESLWGEPRPIHAAAEKCAYLLAECGVPPAAPEGRLYAMAADLSDTTLERRALDAYVEQLTEEYGLLKSEQATSSEWVRGVLDQLALATSENERLRGEHDEAAASRRDLELYLAKLEGQLAEAADGRRELEEYLAKVAGSLEEERGSREAAEAAVRELEGRLEEQAEQAREAARLADARQLSRIGEATEESERLRAERDDAAARAERLEDEVGHARAELASVAAAHAELEQADGERTRWAEALREELSRCQRSLAEARAELERKAEHGEEVDRWARGLADRVSELEAELAERDARRAELEATYAELDAWAKEKGDELAAATAELDARRAELETCRGALRDGEGWARGLGEQLEAAQGEISRLRAEHEQLARLDARRAVWARDLERRLVAMGERPPDAPANDPADEP